MLVFGFRTWDEWSKAAYWDPELNEGEGGYHLFPNRSNSQSLPETERNAGWTSEIYPLDVGQFPDVMSPWGILDMQGGQQEWTEALVLNKLNLRVAAGSPYYDPTVNELFSSDELGVGRTATVQGSTTVGIRLASRVRDQGDLNRD